MGNYIYKHLFSRIQTIPQYERAVVFRLGRIKDGVEQGPGLIRIIPCLDHVERVDTRLKTFDVPPQKVRLPSFKLRLI